MINYYQALYELIDGDFEHEKNLHYDKSTSSLNRYSDIIPCM